MTATQQYQTPEMRRPPLQRETVAGLDIVRALRQDLDLRTYDDVVRHLLREYAGQHEALQQYLLSIESARSDTSARSGKRGKK